MCNTEYKCRICGNIDRLDRWVESDLTTIMKKEIVCHNCSYWFEKIILKDENTVIVNGIRYTIEDEDTPFKGFGGKEFNIEFFDGRTATTHNLWCQGLIPESFRIYPELQDNAKFV